MLVLKIFIGEKNRINISEIKDYLSLQFINISNIQKFSLGAKQLKGNYYHTTPENFDLFNFNNITNFIKTQYHNDKEPDYLYLACYNNDPINDFIINLVF